MNNFPQGIMFHYFHDGSRYPPVQGSVSVDQLEELIKRLRGRIVSPAEWLHRYENGDLVDEIFLSFDDGLAEQLELAVPVLESYGIQGNFNIITCVLNGEMEYNEIQRQVRNKCFADVEEFYKSFFCFLDSSDRYRSIYRAYADYDFNSYRPGSTFYTFNDRKYRYYRDEVFFPRFQEVFQEFTNWLDISLEKLAENIWMSRESIRALDARGHLIGLHTHFHSGNIPKLSYEDQLHDLSLNKATLEEVLGKEVDCLAYALGKCNAATHQAMTKLGINYGFFADGKGYEEMSRYGLPRADCVLALN